MNNFCEGMPITTNRDFLKGFNLLICHFLLMEMYVLTKGQGLA
jgi:hypothetical protein